MLRYLAGRLAQAVGVLWAAYTVSFFVLWALPSDPVSLLLGTDSSDVTPEQLAAVRHEYGYDRPLLVQYVHQLGNVLHGDLGRSVSTREPVSSLLGAAIGPTAQIALAGLVVAVVVGGGLAVVATLTRRPWLRTTLLGLPPLGVAIPGFWFGLMLLQWFSFRLPIFPALGNQGFASIVLPAVTLALPTGAVIAQLLSKSLVVTLREPYVATARAKGASPVRVHLRHALRNAALPALTATGLLVGGLLGGTVVTETVFSRPGLGRLTATAVQAQDIPVVQGVVIVGAVVFVLANLLVDLVYPLLDPRLERRRRTRTADAPTDPAAPVPDGVVAA